MPHAITKTAIFAILAVATATMNGCTPKVTVHTMKDYPKRVGSDMVTIYNIGDTVPQDAEYIGNVMVTSDRSRAENCQYSEVLDKAVKATSEYGATFSP